MPGQREKKQRLLGFLLSFLFHAGVVAVLLLLGFTTHLPLPSEQGIEVNLGSSLEGMGENQPLEPVASREQSSPSPKAETGKEEVVTQDVEEAPPAEKSENKEKMPVESENKEAVQQPVVNPDALYKGKSKTAGGNEGITGKPGDQGVPGGVPGAENYTGPGGQGNDLSYSLTGRSPKLLPKPSRNFTESGTVVIQITVDQYGKVIKAVAIDKGSNTTNSLLRRLAVEAALKSVFNANPDGPQEQKGTITYHFIIRD
jgi:TonB family protein